MLSFMSPLKFTRTVSSSMRSLTQSAGLPPNVGQHVKVGAVDDERFLFAVEV